MKCLFKKQFNLFGILCIVLVLLSKGAIASELYLEPVIQGYHKEEWVPVLDEKGTYYVTLNELAQALDIELNADDLSGAFMGVPFAIHIAQLSFKDYQIKNNRYYFSLPFYEKLFDIGLQVNPYEMQLIVSSHRNLPLKTKILLENRQNAYIPTPQLDGFENYDFDNRWWSFPVMDMTFQKGWSITDYNGPQERSLTSTGYQVDLSMLAFGLDTYASIFGNNTVHHYNPRLRITAGRTFLEEPPNALHLTTFEMGDITGFNSTLFNNSTSGRGAYASSFKDLVLSADKTIDINGPLSDGWQVELYQNNQLIGFRQNSVAGRYQFSNIPVSYGLNVFRLVFYGPYGEVQTEERRYYSGTSPVKSGQFGYILNAYQKERYLFEHNEPYVNPSDKGTLDFAGYYGLNDNISLMMGMSSAPDAVTDVMRNYASVGAQIALNGASFQYNTLYGFKNDAIGHHADVQGNIYIGDVFARYDYYGSLRTPISYYNDTYLKDLAEVRLTGFVPGIQTPYYFSYLKGRDADDQKHFQEMHARLSPSFAQYYNVSIENVWYKDKDQHYDDLVVLLQAQFNELGLHSQFVYRLDPDRYLSSLNQQIDYRWSKYMYVQMNWDHDCRSNYTNNDDLDTFSISAGRLFSFGGLTLALSVNSDKDAAIMLTYNIGMGKIPDKPRPFTNAQDKITQRSTMYMALKDDLGHPVKGAQLHVSGRQEPVVSNEAGEVLVADMEPYAKTWITVDPTSLEDISLIPKEEKKKLVLRPGTVLPVELSFIHKGGFEGWIKTPQKADTYRLVLYDDKGQKRAVQVPQKDGSFLFDDLTFGTYQLEVLNPAGKKVAQKQIHLHTAFEELNHPIFCSQ